MKCRQIGFTLIELLVVVGMVAILASLATPSFRTLLVKRSVQTAADSLVSDMRYARSEALKRSTVTYICRSTSGTDCAAAVGSWNDGWIVFVDMNEPPNARVDAGVDEVIRVQQALPNIASIQAPVLANTVHTYRYEATGFAKGAQSSFVLTPDGSVPAGSTRLLCVSSTGRPALRKVGDSAC